MAVPQALAGAKRLSRWAPGKPATADELSQIAGAREALADYIGVLQEWSLRAEQGGAATEDWPQ